jgi:NAD(P)H dehydrogenase (quinone)
MGADGRLGRRVAEELAATGAVLRLAARDAALAPQLPDAQAVEVDVADAAGLRRAFAGTARAFIVPAPGPPSARAGADERTFEAAAAAGLEHVVYLSVQGASPTSRSALARERHAGEAALAASGLHRSVLRANLELELVPALFGSDGVARVPAGEGAVAFVARDDVARVIAAALLAEPRGDGHLDVTGPEALTLADVAQRLSALTGLDLRYEDEAIESARARLEPATPEWEVDAFLAWCQAIAGGELARVSDAVPHLTGREPTGLDAFVRANAPAFAHLRPDSAG